MGDGYGKYSTSMVREDPLTVVEWMISLIILMIPVVNIIMTFVWAFGSGNITRKNFCRASLIMALLGTVIAIIIALATFMSLRL